MEIYRTGTRAAAMIELILIALRLLFYVFIPPVLTEIVWTENLQVVGSTLITHICVGILMFQLLGVILLFIAAATGTQPKSVSKLCHFWTGLNSTWIFLLLLQILRVIPLEMTTSRDEVSWSFAVMELTFRVLAVFVVLVFKEKVCKYQYYTRSSTSSSPTVVCGGCLEDVSSMKYQRCFSIV
ncbi:unnamed protein product [Orchesella dallaii]|uniref:Transmembrane protein n=1 Tax=Orchesella dallaii TaxID=48710 RepID=A0ABP1R4F5_9HEXA